MIISGWKWLIIVNPIIILYTCGFSIALLVYWKGFWDGFEKFCPHILGRCWIFFLGKTPETWKKVGLEIPRGVWNLEGFNDFSLGTCPRDDQMILMAFLLAPEQGGPPWGEPWKKPTSAVREFFIWNFIWGYQQITQLNKIFHYKLAISSHNLAISSHNLAII